MTAVETVPAITTPAVEPGQDMCHVFCQDCPPNTLLLCGLKTGYAAGTEHETDCGKPHCVVCTALRYAPCPRCGAL